MVQGLPSVSHQHADICNMPLTFCPLLEWGTLRTAQADVPRQLHVCCTFERTGAWPAESEDQPMRAVALCHCYCWHFSASAPKGEEPKLCPASISRSVVCAHVTAELVGKGRSALDLGVFMIRNTRWSRMLLDLLAHRARTSHSSQVRSAPPMAPLLGAPVTCVLLQINPADHPLSWTSYRAHGRVPGLHTDAGARRSSPFSQQNDIRVDMKPRLYSCKPRGTVAGTGLTGKFDMMQPLPSTPGRVLVSTRARGGDEQRKYL